MTDTATPPPAPAPDATGPAVPARARRSLAGWVALLALMVAGGAMAAAYLLWQRMDSTHQELVRRSAEASTVANESRAQVRQGEATVLALQARLGVAEQKLSEVTLQRSQLEELMLSVSRSRDDSLVLDIESALRLAQQQAQITGSATPLVSALQAADQRIARAAQPRLNPVQRAIARDIERIRSVALVDVPSLALRMDELLRMVDELPLAEAVDGTALSVQGAQPPRAVSKDAPATGTSGAPESVQDAMQRLGLWWERALRELAARSGELVRLQRIDRPEAVLLAPDQAFFLRENLKLQLLNARLSLLSRQFDAARAATQAARQNLSRYFDMHAAPSRLAERSLSQLVKDLVAVDMPRPDDTLAALATAAEGR